MRGTWLLALALACAAHAQDAPPDDLLALAMTDSQPLGAGDERFSYPLACARRFLSEMNDVPAP